MKLKNMKDTQYQPIKMPNGEIKYILITYVDVGHGPMVYLIFFKDTNKFYIGSTKNGDDRIQGHFTHESKKNGVPYYVYQEALKNYNIEVRMLRSCNSIPEAKYWENNYLREGRKKFGDRLLNIRN